MPEALPCRGIKGNETVREEIRTVTIAAVEIGLRGFGWDINNAALFIERLTTPWHYTSGGFVCLGRPGIVTEFTRTWNQMENPASRSRPDIEGAQRTRTTDPTDDQKILVSDTRRVQADPRRAVHIQACAQVN